MAQAFNTITLNGRKVAVSDRVLQRLQAADSDMRADTGKGIEVTSSARTTQQQAQLYAQLKPKGARVAPPGKSFHETGQAVDVANWKEAQKYLNRYGLNNDLTDDKGHFSFGETRQSPYGNFLSSVETGRQRGYTDTELLDIFASKHPEKASAITKARANYGNSSVNDGITNDRDLINFLAIKYGGAVPKVASVAPKVAPVLPAANNVPAKTVPEATGGGFFKQEAMGGAQIPESDPWYKKLGKEVFQYTLGSKGIAGVAQRATRAVESAAAPLVGKQSTEQIQADVATSTGNLAETTTKAIIKYRNMPEGAARQRLLTQINSNLQTMRDNGQVVSDLERQIETPRKVISTTANAALTALSGSGSLVKSGMQRAAGSMSVEAASKVPLIYQALTKAATAGRSIIPRMIEQGAIGAGFAASSNIENDRPITEGVGTATAVGSAIPLVGSALAKVSPKAVGTGLITKAQKLYQSALKPSLSKANVGKIPSIINTGLKEAIYLTERGVAKTAANIDNLEAKLGSAIDKAAKEGKTVATAPLQSFVETAKEMIQNLTDVEYSVKASADIDAIWNNFYKKYGESLPVEVAQKIKTSTYRWLKDAYGELSTPVKEANKQLARGLKEGIVASVDVVGNINARLSKLYEFDEALSRAKGRIGNLNLLGLGQKMYATGAAASDTTVGRVASAVMFLADKFGGSPAAKSWRAVQYYRIGKLIEQASPSERLKIFRDAPYLKPIFDRVFGQKSAETIDEAGIREAIKKFTPGLTIQRVEEGGVNNIPGKLQDSVDALMAKAKKYKSAEEFVKSQGKQFYHGGEGIKGSINPEYKTNFQKVAGTGEYKKGFSITSEKNVGEKYGSVVDEIYISPDAKIASPKDLPEVEFTKFPDGEILFNQADAVKIAKEKGFDGIDLNAFEQLTTQPNKNLEIQIFNADKIKTKSQLTDIWNKAHNKNLPSGKVSGKAVAAGGIAATAAVAGGLAMLQAKGGKKKEDAITPAQTPLPYNINKMLTVIRHQESRGEKHPYSFTRDSGNKNLGRALGAYQVTEGELKTYSKMYLGRLVSPDEFLADPHLQDAFMLAKLKRFQDEFGFTPAEAFGAHRGGINDTDGNPQYVKEAMALYEK